MARPVSTDFIHSMRFQATVVDPAGISLTPDGRADAGFSMVSTPEATVEAVEYKEGTWIYTRKYPGNPTFAEISMSRGVARRDSTFWDWIRRVIEGSGEYRADIDIKHYHRDNSLLREYPTSGGVENVVNLETGSPARVYHVKQAFPSRHKVAGDMDATASEISIMELDLTFEYFEVEEGTSAGSAAP